jgi:hypothetical protein
MIIREKTSYPRGIARRFKIFSDNYNARIIQIPPHGGHPCLKLMATTAFTIRDSHPIDSAHAGRTLKKTSLEQTDLILINLLLSISKYTLWCMCLYMLLQHSANLLHLPSTFRLKAQEYLLLQMLLLLVLKIR